MENFLQIQTKLDVLIRLPDKLCQSKLNQTNLFNQLNLTK